MAYARFTALEVDGVIPSARINKDIDPTVHKMGTSINDGATRLSRAFSRRLQVPCAWRQCEWVEYRPTICRETCPATSMKSGHRPRFPQVLFRVLLILPLWRICNSPWTGLPSRV